MLDLAIVAFVVLLIACSASLGSLMDGPGE